jgi:hypothetical protein
MERLIKINGFEVKTEVPDEACKACPFLYGEMGQVLQFLKLEPGELTAEVACHARSVKTRHINIKLHARGKNIDADDSIRNWIGREVHCNKI